MFSCKPPLTCSVILALMSAARSDGAVTTGSLLDEMTDMTRLSQSPSPAYKCKQFSSYDRRSVAPYLPGWFDNSDGFGNEPIPNVLATLKEPDADGTGRYLLADVSGPGAIVRTWTPHPHPIKGNLAIFLDGSNTPIWQGDPDAFVSNRPACFTKDGKPAQDGFRQVDANYFPVPFAMGLRVEWTGRIKDLHFYHIGVRLYEPGTEVVSFQSKDVETYADSIAKAARALQSADAWREAEPAGERVPFSVAIEPGAAVEAIKLDKPGMIAEFGIKLEAKDIPAALRQTILSGYFDGSWQPQIESPVGDFFGSWPGITPYDSIPMTVRADGTMVCRFAMPFRQSALLKLRNLGRDAVRVTGWRVVKESQNSPKDLLHYHCKWRVNHGLEASGGTETRDLPFLNVFGKGVFVGASVAVLNPTPIITGGGSWWGEGDEKIWVDDDAFPSFFGTGSEDYFNYSWSSNRLFQHGYCAQPMSSGPASRGYCVNTRWHVLDAIPFRGHFAFFMELAHHTYTPGLSYARTTHYYAPPQTTDDHVKICPPDLERGMDLPADWEPSVYLGCKEASLFYQAENCADLSKSNVSVIGGRMWSRGKLMVWKPQAEGEQLDINLKVPETGKYLIACVFRVSPNSGKFSLAVDDRQPMAQVADLYAPHLEMLRDQYFDVVELDQGPHSLRLISRGKNPESAGAEIGLDFIMLWERK
ncbi:MAG TPA: DUF2961 domain-containing protein [Candidatus Brocadiia bacterium]|nr:DUF2961 domain-containing protein [Candidatus Brocadiia bacterium]